MKLGICVRYSYDGDEIAWEKVISDFVNSIAQDADLAGKFTYHVQKANEGSERVHIGRWDAPETVKLLQSRAYFTAFATQLREMAGDTLAPLPFSVTHSATP